jgi:hypothetical protein
MSDEPPPPEVPLAPNKGGRPRILQPDDKTLKELSGLAVIMCTTKEGAAFFRVSEPTFLKFLADYPEARAAWDDGRGQGKMSLRRKQWALADKNAAMAIFLGKNYLGQADQTNVKHDGSVGIFDATKHSDERLAALVAALADPSAGPGTPEDREGGTGEEGGEETT